VRAPAALGLGLALMLAAAPQPRGRGEPDAGEAPATGGMLAAAIIIVIVGARGARGAATCRVDEHGEGWEGCSDGRMWLGLFTSLFLTFAGLHT
jgi:hypothetical protein